MLSFTSLEDSVMQLVGTQEAVNGLNGDTFGGGSSTDTMIQDHLIGETFQMEQECIQSNDNPLFTNSVNETAETTNVISEETIIRNREKTPTQKTDSITRVQLLQQQCTAQDNFFCDLSKTLKSIDDTNKEILKYLKKCFYLKEKKYELEKRKIKIMEQTNVDTLKAHVETLEVKQRKLELEEQKLENWS